MSTKNRAVTDFDLGNWMERRQSLVRARLADIINELDTGSLSLKQAIQYCLGGGKFVRPLLLFATYEIFANDYESLLLPACALELIHTYSLIHDDLPAMDDDDLRRGQPSCHIAFDEATAILAGDAMQALAFSLLVDSAFDPTTKVNLIKILSDASGAKGMVDGQALDMEYETREVTLNDLSLMCQKKTGSLVKAAVLMGLSSAKIEEPDTWQKLSRIGENLGVLFQIQDDILDVAQDTRTLGKPAGSDVDNQKQTYVSILGLGAAREQAEKLHDKITQDLKTLGWDTGVLQSICSFILNRKF